MSILQKTPGHHVVVGLCLEKSLVNSNSIAAYVCVCMCTSERAAEVMLILTLASYALRY
jgi:hypothetical protein